MSYVSFRWTCDCGNVYHKAQQEMVYDLRLSRFANDRHRNSLNVLGTVRNLSKKPENYANTCLFISIGFESVTTSRELQTMFRCHTSIGEGRSTFASTSNPQHSQFLELSEITRNIDDPFGLPELSLCPGSPQNSCNNFSEIFHKEIFRNLRNRAS